MFQQTTLFLALSWAALCLATKFQEGHHEITSKAGIRKTTFSESEILLSVTACVAGVVLIVLIPTIVYNKCFNKEVEIEKY